jgi:uncharacterized protein YchJ
VVDMAKKDDELVLLIDRNELEKKARRDNKLNDSDAQNFIDSIMTNYFLDNDNINFLESKGIAYFTFKDSEQCFCISGKKYGECCKLKLATDKDETYVPYIKSLMNENDYANYVARMNKIYLEEKKNYSENTNCFFPECENKTVENKFYHDVKANDFVTTKVANPLDARYKMGEVFFKTVDENGFKYFGFCQKHFDAITELYEKKDLDDQDVLNLSLEVIVFRLINAMILLRVAQKEYLQWYNSVEEEGYQAYMTVHLRKVSENLKGILNLYKLITENIRNQSLLRLKIWKVKLPHTNKFICRDIVAPQLTPDDFKLVNSVNNVLITPKFLVQNMIQTKKETIVYYLYEKVDDAMANFVKQYQLKLLNKKKETECFVSNTSLILTDCILFSKNWFEKQPQQDQMVLSALNKFRFDQPDIGREYIKMQFFASFDKGNNFF